MSAFQDLPPFFQAHIALSPGGCWLWTGELNRNGYGTFRVRLKPGIRKRKMVHIEVYVAIKGEYDRSLLLDHVCRVRNCCNPDHLEPVTVRENTMRGEAVLFKPKTLHQHCHAAAEAVANWPDWKREALGNST